jgi:hypothetical protein
MNAPQIVMIVLFSVSLTISAYDHGKLREGRHNFFINLISAALMFGLLFWGGFFR